MWKLFLALLFLIAQSQEGFCVTQWAKGVPAATDLKSIWPATSQANNSILDTLLQNYQRGFYITYSSATTLLIGPGELVVSNSGGGTRLFLVKSTTTNVTSANLDTGSITGSTTYYVYAGTSTATAASPTFYISLSSTAPSGVTYYEQIGTFTTDSSSNFQGIINNNVYNFVQAPVSKSSNVVYQALTDGWVTATINTNGSSYSGSILIGTTNSPATEIAYTIFGNDNVISSFVPKGWYYEISSTASPREAYFFPLSN